MPLVSIHYSHVVDQETLTRIVPALCETIAEQLTCTDDNQTFHVTPKMVKVRFAQTSPLDVNMPNLYIEIEARAFKNRIPHVEEYAAAVGKAVAPLLPPHIHASVWFKLFDAGWHSSVHLPGSPSKT